MCNLSSIPLEMLEIGMYICGLKGCLMHSINNYIFVYFNYHS